jgi:hypothetical protein
VKVGTAADRFTVIVRVAVALTPALVAVTVYVALVVRAVGVPEITPVVAFKLRPAGSAGEAE